jgi:hypothetical protein
VVASPVCRFTVTTQQHFTTVTSVIIRPRRNHSLGRQLSSHRGRAGEDAAVNDRLILLVTDESAK